jgi:hypothetical protein
MFRAGPASDGEPTLADILVRIWSRRWHIALTSAALAALFFVIAIVMPPSYRVTAILVPANTAQYSQMIVGGLGAISGPASARRSQTFETLAIIRSREFTEKFIADFDLQQELRQPTLAGAAQRFGEICRASFDEATGLVYLRIDWRDPVKAAAWIEAITSRVNAVMRERELRRSGTQVASLRSYIASSTGAEGRGQAARLLEYRLGRQMVASVSPDYALRTVDRAKPPDLRYGARPDRYVVAVLGAVLGLIAGIAVALIVRPSR